MGNPARVIRWPCFLCEFSAKRKAELTKHFFKIHKIRIVKLLMVYHPDLRINPMSDATLSERSDRNHQGPTGRVGWMRK